MLISNTSLCTVCLCLSINSNQILFRKIKKKCYHSSSNNDHWFYIYLSYHLQLFDVLMSKAFHTLNRLFTHSTDRSINQIWSPSLHFSVFYPYIRSPEYIEHVYCPKDIIQTKYILEILFSISICICIYLWQ